VYPLCSGIKGKDDGGASLALLWLCWFCGQDVGFYYLKFRYEKEKNFSQNKALL
jgi:hypothetical protein